MRTTQHQKHIDTRVSHTNCPECRADCERRFVDTQPWRYQHVHEYLKYVRPLMALIRNGHDSLEARQWLRKFRDAMDRRINLKAGVRNWRKLNDGYEYRLRGMSHVHNAAYLRQFASKGASTL